MIQFFNVFSFLFTSLAILATFIMCILLGKGKYSDSDEAFDNCFRQTKTCRLTSIIFVILSWFLISGKETDECLDLYVKLSVNCSRLGYIWIGSAFITIIMSLYLNLRKRSFDGTQKLNTLRNSGFFQGTVFLIFSFLLNVQ